MRKSRLAYSILKARTDKSEPPSNFSMQAFHNVTITLDGETKDLLRSIDATLQKLAEASSTPVSEPGTPESIEEPMELSINIPEPLTEPMKYPDNTITESYTRTKYDAIPDHTEKKYGHMVYAADLPDEWNCVAEYPALKWKEEDSMLVISYHKSTVRNLTWDNIEDLIKIPKDKRMAQIVSATGIGHSNNKKTAVSVFCQCVERGLIKLPDKDPDIESEMNFAQFVQDEDPDSIFRPMVTPYISTRPMEDGGKIEGTLEVV